jgi:hypothetical protein
MDAGHPHFHNRMQAYGCMINHRFGKKNHGKAQECQGNRVYAKIADSKKL